MNAHHMSCGIFTESKHDAKQILDYIRMKRDEKSEVIWHDKSNSIYLEIMTNKERKQYKWMHPIVNSRGYRFHSVYIDLDLPVKTIENEIYPLYCLYASKEDIHVFDSRNKSLCMDLDTVLDRLIKIRYIYGNIADIEYDSYEFLQNPIYSIAASSGKVTIGACEM